MSVKSDAIKCAIFCSVLIVAVCFLRIIHSPYPFAKLFHAKVHSAVLAALHPTSMAPNSTSSLRYDLSVNITVRGEDVWYRDYAATALYNGSMLGVPETWSTAKHSGEGPYAAVDWASSFRGTVAVYPSVAAELQRERMEGTLHVRVRVSVTLVRKPRPFTSFVYNNYDCWLWFPPPAHAAPAVFGEGTQCWPAK